MKKKTPSSQKSITKKVARSFQPRPFFLFSKGSLEQPTAMCYPILLAMNETHNPTTHLEYGTERLSVVVLSLRDAQRREKYLSRGMGTGREGTGSLGR